MADGDYRSLTLFNLRGEVVGIVCHIVTSSFGSEGLGFAMTSNAVREIIVERRQPWLGFDGLQLPSSLSRALNVPHGKRGMLVLSVAKSSPAQRCGLLAGTIPVKIGELELLLGGDIVLEILGHPLGSPREVEQAMQAVRELPPGSTLRMSVLREGTILDLVAEIRD